MSELVLFAIGACVTLMVFSAFALLVWAELQDGRTQAKAERGVPHDLSETDAERPIVTLREAALPGARVAEPE